MKSRFQLWTGSEKKRLHRSSQEKKKKKSERKGARKWKESSFLLLIPKLFFFSFPSSLTRPCERNETFLRLISLSSNFQSEVGRPIRGHAPHYKSKLGPIRYIKGSPMPRKSQEDIFAELALFFFFFSSDLYLFQA